MTCPKHPKYQAKRKPAVSCAACWQVYFIAHPISSDKILGRPIRCNKRTLEPKGGKDYAEVVFLGDVHWGSPQCDKTKFLAMIDYCKRNKISIFLMGDLIEAATRSSVGAGIYEQEFIGQTQYEEIVDCLRPVKHLIIGSHRGNHEFRIYQESGVDVSKAICRELDIPYLGDACWSQFRVGKQTYSLYTLHGRSGSRFDGTSLLAIERIAVNFNADVVAMGHAHKCVSSVMLSQRIVNGVVREMKKTIIVTGCFLKYDGGYASTIGLPPSKLGAPKVKFFGGDKKDVHVSW